MRDSVDPVEAFGTSDDDVVLPEPEEDDIDWTDWDEAWYEDDEDWRDDEPDDE